MASAPSILAQPLAKALQVLAKDLTLISESDYPYRAFSAPMPKAERLSAGSFRLALRIPARFPLRFAPARGFFEYYEDAEDHGEIAERYVLLHKVMRTTLTGLSTVHVEGNVRVPFFLFGRLPDGTLVGLRSTAIET